MTSYKELIELYSERLKEAEEKLNRVKRKIYNVGTVKLIIFIAMIAALFYGSKYVWQVNFSIIVIGVIVFIILSRYHTRLFQQKDYLKVLKQINKQELNGLNHDFMNEDSGEEFINYDHLYTHDLDVFGRGSLFQYINRSATQLGREKLASWLINQLHNKKEILKRQNTIKALSEELETRQEFRATGLLFQGKSADKEEIDRWAKSPLFFKNRVFIRLLPIGVLACNIIVIVLAWLNIIPVGIYSTIFVAFIIGSSIFTKQISKQQSIYSKKLAVLNTYAKLIEIIENWNIEDEEIDRIKRNIQKSNKNASKAIKELSKKMNALDQRYNVYLALILNGLCLWELKQFMRIEEWKEKYASHLSIWLDAVAEVDAYCSLATFAYNHPNYNFPVISNEPFILEGEGLGHPLMNRAKCVVNDIDIPKEPYFLIITGANMAGKSTYLRTVGVNYLLASIGAPVCASSLKFYPSQLITSLRTTDSLTDSESYFFAELKRLKLIIDKLEKGEELFILLDEILKGTNSVDKQKGSLALIKQFIELKTDGIIATHDLLLGELIKAYPNNITNYRFEADIKNNELTFSYKLREGVAQNMNACFLMKKMGIAIIED